MIHFSETVVEMEVLTKAANILDVSEYEVLHLAYVHWHGSEAPNGTLQLTFSAYLNTQELPHWARHYAMQIIRTFEAELQREGNFLKFVWLLFCPHISTKDDYYLIA